jgi:glycosyltransferase involved in cell wall biosynthesis
VKVGYFLRDDGACGYYRVDLPLTTLSRKEGILVERFQQGEGFSKLLEIIKKATILVIPRMCEKPFIEMCKSLRKEGIKIIVDHDDNMFEVSPLSNHYKECGCEETKIKTKDGMVINLWEDGKNIDIKKNRERIDNFKKALEVADMVTVTTDILAGIYKEYNDNINVLPNCVDIKLWQKLPLKPHEGVRMGWFGGSSHYEDWTLMEDVLPDVMKKYPQLILVIMGQMFEGTLRDIPEDRIEFHNWVPTPAYPYKSAILDLDFSIIPLRDNKFNHCKSSIKWIEQGALGCPAVTSYVSPYKEIATEENGIFIEDNDPLAWKEGIGTMIEDKLARSGYGLHAYQTAREFDIENKYILWREAYESLQN